MRLIVFREADTGEAGAAGPGLLRYALSTAPLDRLIFGAFDHPWSWPDARRGAGKSSGAMNPGRLVWAVPRRWELRSSEVVGQTVAYEGDVDVRTVTGGNIPRHSCLVVSNGRFVTRLNYGLVAPVLADASVAVVAVTVTPALAAFRELVRLTQEDRLVGYRRLYGDSVEPTPLPGDWPHHLFVKHDVVDRLFVDGLPRDFLTFVERCRSLGWGIKSVSVGGAAFDLNSEDGLLSLSRTVLGGMSTFGSGAGSTKSQVAPSPCDTAGVSSGSRLIGPVWLGPGARVESQAVVIGPSILCEGSVVRAGSVVDSSIVGSETTLGQDEVLRDAILVKGKVRAGAPAALAAAVGSPEGTRAADAGQVFRTWPVFSYARLGKRVADVIAAVGVLILFAPIIPLIALAVKVSSPGPTFFRDKRQGRHGKPFHCIKFRTMRVGADKMQDKLRFVSEVDGPQFKMADDPRITTVGRFLRETYLDEIPQFFNVLMGEMSVVGPRPSPESENTLCASWRDARLSIRPGITGLWQVYRTREPLKDFQEWIHYDTKYVRELSVRMDLWICWRTFTKMVYNFIRQF
ncbi:MAG: sugar transferase [Sedimentisphaerales bacterium]|nr:sugar transferase [Sedimentisphaerales bacterium]